MNSSQTQLTAWKATLLRCALALLAVVIFSSEVLAQTSTGSIAGTVVDPSGAAMPGVDLRLVNTETGETRSGQSNEVGRYSFQLLTPGTYRIDATTTGFKRWLRDGIKLDVALALNVPVSMELGEVAEVVEVTSVAPPLESTTSSLGHLIENQRITELPLNGRNAYGFATLVPGVRASRGFTRVAYDMYTDQFVSINGSRPNQNAFYLDGGSNTTAGFNGAGFFPSPDMVAEYKVQTNNFSAEFSDTTGGVINVVSKTGTNQFHGAIFEFLRHDKLTANDFFLNRAGGKEAPFRFNQFGATVGGPIVKNRTFFFFSWESLRWSRPLTINGTLPTDLHRMGDFSDTRTQGGALVNVYDPQSTRPDPANQGKFIRTPFENNMIPQARFDPVSRNLIALTPHGNMPGDPFTGANNYLLSNSAPINKDQYSIRGDHTITDNHKLFMRYSWNDTARDRPDFYGADLRLSQPNAGPDSLIQKQATLNYTAILSPTVVLEATSSWIRYWLGRDSYGLGYDSTQLGLPQSIASLPLEPCFPRINVSGMSVGTSVPDVGAGFLGNCGFLGNSFDTYHDAGNLTIIRGQHTFKTGASWASKNWSARNFLTAAQTYNFNSGFTQGSDPLVGGATRGFGYASFLLGNGTGNIRSSGLSQNVQTRTFGFYFQDDWKVTNKLTFNLGMRYDNARPWTERFDRVTSWCHTCPSPLAGQGTTLTGGLAFPGVDGRSRYLYETDNNNWAPRFGFAYQLNSGTVIRGGYGLFYGPVQGGAVNGTSTPRSGFEATTSWLSTVDGITPVNALSDPYPDGFEVAPGNTQGLSTLLGQTVTVMDPDRSTPYSQQWNLNIQRQLPGNFIIDVAYAGSRGLHLFGPLLANQLSNQFLAMGDGLRTLVDNPFFGSIQTGTLAQPKVTQGQLLRPFPQFTGVTLGNNSYGASTYHSGQLKVERRFSAGLSVLMAYTYSKTIDDVRASTAGAGFPGESFATPSLVDFTDRRGARAPAQFDAPHVMTMNAVWELPFGKQKRFLKSGILAWIAGNWQVNSIMTLQSGAPLGLSSQSNTLRNFGGVQTPNLSGGDPTKDGPVSQRLDEYFNVSAFSVPAPYTYGNVGRLVGWLRAPGVANFDLSLAKNIPINERIRMQFRFETFNSFNHPQFDFPNTSIGSASAGRINQQANTPRDIQFGLKLLF